MHLKDGFELLQRPQPRKSGRYDHQYQGLIADIHEPEKTPCRSLLNHLRPTGRRRKESDHRIVLKC